MITADKVGTIRQEAQRRTAHLSYEERTQLAQVAMGLSIIRSVTLDNAYYREALTLLYDLAPTLATEIRRVMDLADTLNLRTQ